MKKNINREYLAIKIKNYRIRYVFFELITHKVARKPSNEIKVFYKISRIILTVYLNRKLIFSKFLFWVRLIFRSITKL